MKNLQLLIILALLAFVLSCKKNNDTQIQANYDSPRIKRMTLTDTTGKYIYSETFQYDAQGRVVQGMLDFPPYYDSSISKYEYYQDSVVKKIFYADYSKMGRLVFYLNSNGLATFETAYKYNQGGDSILTQTVTYKYNTDGFMIEQKALIAGDTALWSLTKYQIVNGNISSSTFTNDNCNEGYITTSYDYYSGSANSLGEINKGLYYLGKSSSNLVKTYIMRSGTGSPQSISYSYSFDSKNRVNKIFSREIGPSLNNNNTVIEYY